MSGTKLISPPHMPSRQPFSRAGLAGWWADMQASHQANREYRAWRRRRKLELMPLTAFEQWFYPVLFGGITLMYGFLILGEAA